MSWLFKGIPHIFSYLFILTPSANRKDIIKYSDAWSLGLIISSSIVEVPRSSTPLSQSSGCLIVVVAILLPPSVILPCAPGPTPI